MNTSEKPLVSIALCTYNGNQYLEQLLNSLLQQDYESIEIIALDDCSTDSSVEILQKYAQEFPYIKVFRNTENLGFLKNFEKSLSLCQGEYIAFCDQDDIWAYNKISLQVENIGSYGLIYHDSDLIDDADASLSIKISDLINMYEGDSSIPFLLRNCVSGHSILIHRRMLEHITPFRIEYHDWWSAYVIAGLTGIKYLDYCLVKYRQHGSSSTKILKQSQENPYYPSLENLQVFNNFNNNKATLVTSIYNVWKHQDTLNFSFKELFSLMKNYKLFFFISKVPNREKFNFIAKLLLKKMRLKSSRKG